MAERLYPETDRTEMQGTGGGDCGSIGKGYQQ